MKRNNQNFILLFFLFFSSFVFCQEQTSEYVIITYKVNINKGHNHEKNYYWIIPLDSLNDSLSMKKYPLYFDNFSSDDLKDCRENKDLYLFSYHSDEEFILDDKMQSDINNLKRIVKDNRTKVERITKKWGKGYKEKITIYATPIKGEFCIGNMSSSDEKFTNYKGLVYLPTGNFSYNKLFSESETYNQIKKEYYLNTNYKNNRL